MQSLVQQKIGLRNYDDKRYILADGVSSYAYGHKRIAEVENEPCPELLCS